MVLRKMYCDEAQHFPLGLSVRLSQILFQIPPAPAVSNSASNQSREADDSCILTVEVHSLVVKAL